MWMWRAVCFVEIIILITENKLSGKKWLGIPCCGSLSPERAPGRVYRALVSARARIFELHLTAGKWIYDVFYFIFIINVVSFKPNCRCFYWLNWRRRAELHTGEGKTSSLSFHYSSYKTDEHDRACMHPKPEVQHNEKVFDFSTALARKSERKEIDKKRALAYRLCI